MPKAVKLTEENIPHLIDYASKLQFNLDYLQDEMSYNTEEFGCDTYLITDGTPEENNVTFTAKPGIDFLHIWKFENPQEWTHGFTRIVRI